MKSLVCSGSLFLERRSHYSTRAPRGRHGDDRQHDPNKTTCHESRARAQALNRRRPAHNTADGHTLACGACRAAVKLSILSHCTLWSLT